MLTYLYIVQIVIAIVLIAAIILQARGAGLGGVFGGGSTTFRTRRGVEKRLFQATVVLAVAFIILSVVAVKLVAIQQ